MHENMYDKNKATGNDPNIEKQLYSLKVLIFYVCFLILKPIFWGWAVFIHLNKWLRNRNRSELTVSASSAKTTSFGGLCTHRTKPWFVSSPLHTNTFISPVQVTVCKDLCSPQCLSYRHKGYWGVSLWTRCCRADMKSQVIGAETCIPSSAEAVNVFLCPAQARQHLRPHFSKFRIEEALVAIA